MNSLFLKISVSAKEIKQDVYLIGTSIISSIIERPFYQKIDLLTNGSIKLLAEQVSKKLHHYPILIFFKRFSTIRFKKNGKQIEFIGNNIDLYYNINTIAISINTNTYGLLIDNFINSSSSYEKLFSIIRSIRIACEFKFIEQISLYYLFEQKDNIKVLFLEEIINDFNKIILSKNPSIGLLLLHETNLLSILLPEVTNLKEVEEKEEFNHKDNFYHTLEVLENISRESNSLWLRWSALLHDIGKSITKKYIYGIGWSFHGHECMGSRMIPSIFYRLNLPMGDTLKYVQKIVQYSSRPIALVSYEATSSAIRRLFLSLEEDLEDLLLLCKSDITTKKFKKKLRYMKHFFLVEKKLRNLILKSKYQNLYIPISGNEIMHFFKLHTSPQIGLIKNAIKETILETNITHKFPYVYYFSCMKNIN